MKDKIYTIPVNEAFDADTECPLCFLRKKLENEAVEYALGAAMMEPDYRVISNEKGYCNKHFAMLFKKPNKLSLALVLETHLQQLKKSLDRVCESSQNNGEQKKSFFKKKDELSDSVDRLKDAVGSCLICEKLDSTLERYIRVLFYMWKEDDAFHRKMRKSKGFCLGHFVQLIEGAKKYLSKEECHNFCVWLSSKESQEIDRIAQDVHNFTLKFDYRFHDKPWGTEKDGPERCVEKISGYIV